MIMPRHAPPGAYVDDPAETIDRADRAESAHTLVLALASEGFTRIGEWITRGRGGAKPVSYTHLDVYKRQSLD